MVTARDINDKMCIRDRIKSGTIQKLLIRDDIPSGI